MTRSEGGDWQLRRYEEIILRMQHGHLAAKIFSSLFKSPIVQSSQPKAGFGKIEQRWIDQCSMVAGHGRHTECQPNRPQRLHDLNWIIQAGIDLLYMRAKADQIFDCLINQTDNVGSLAWHSRACGCKRCAVLGRHHRARCDNRCSTQVRHTSLGCPAPP